MFLLCWRTNSPTNYCLLSLCIYLYVVPNLYDFYFLCGTQTELFLNNAHMTRILYVHYIPNLLKPNDNTADNLPLQWAVTGLLSQWVELENCIRPICEQIIQTTFMYWKNRFIDSFFSNELSWTHEVKPWWMSRFSVNNNFNFNLSTSNLMVLLCHFWLNIALDTIHFH